MGRINRDNFGNEIQVGDFVVFHSSYDRGTSLNKEKVVGFSKSGRVQILKDVWKTIDGKYQFVKEPYTLRGEYCKCY